MNKSAWKRPVALGLAFTMMLSMTACGDKKGSKGGSSDSLEKDYGDVKNMVFSGEELDLADVKGDFGSLVVSGDKIYFEASEWPEFDEEAIGEVDGSDDSLDEGTVTEDISEDGSSADESADDSAEAGDSVEETSEDDSKSSEDTDEPKEAAVDDVSEADNDNTDSDTADDTDIVTDETLTDDTDVAGDEEVDYKGDIQVTTRIYSMNIDCTGVTEICEPKLEANEYINYLLVDKDGKLNFLTATWDEKSGKQTYYIEEINDDGSIANRQDISSGLDIGEDSYISKVLLDDENRLIVVSSQKIIILSSDYKKLGEVAADNNSWIEGAAKTLDGSIVCGFSGSDGAVVQTLDVDNQKLGDKIELDLSYFNGGDALTDGSGDYDFYYKDDKGIYGYSLKDKKTTKILDYLASEIDGNNSYGITILSSDVMIGTGWNEETGKSILTLYTKKDPSEVKDKITITYGALWGVDDNIRNAAIKFNKENDKYRIEFKDYNDNYESLEDAQSKMNAEFATGNIPDIIDLSYLPYQQYITKGMLEDLTPYFDKDDEVNKEDIIPSVEKTMETDGKLYYIAPSFSIQTLIAAKKDVGDKTGWDFAEFKDLLEEKGDDVRPFYSENKTDIMDSFLYNSIDDYIDWTTGKCRFDSDDFKSILELSSRGVDEEMDYSEDAPSQPSLIKSGKVLFADGWLEAESVELYSMMYDDDITFIGYPCEDKQGSFFSFENQLGIYSKSEVKDGAWDFIKTMMTKDYQATGGHIWSNPTNKDAFETYMKTKTATEAYTDEYGNKIEPLETSWGWDDLDVEIGPLNADQEKMYRDLINNTTKVSGYNESIMNIIKEETKSYFSGQKGVDETADIIQNRVTTYVNENR